jgi:hypothetical protein
MAASSPFSAASSGVNLIGRIGPSFNDTASDAGGARPQAESDNNTSPTALISVPLEKLALLQQLTLPVDARTEA